MQKKPLALIIVSLIIALAGAVGFYIYENSRIEEPPFSEDISFEDLQKDPRLIEKESFSLYLPEGWQESEAGPQFVLKARKDSEEFASQAAESLGFKSYLAVTLDDLGTKDLSSYIEALKEFMFQTMEEVSFEEKEQETVDGLSVRFVEAGGTDENLELKILMAFVQDQESKAWTLVFNTTDSYWEEYKEDFYESVRSFDLK